MMVPTEEASIQKTEEKLKVIKFLGGLDLLPFGDTH